MYLQHVYRLGQRPGLTPSLKTLMLRRSAIEPKPAA